MLVTPITGDFQRDYKFNFALFNTNVTVGVALGLTAVALIYVSSLAQKIDLPSKEVSLQEVPISIVPGKYMSGVRLDPVVVTYLEDSVGSVFQFHQAWQDSARDKGSLTFTEIGNVCISAIYTPNFDVPIFGLFAETPSSSTIWKYIFPYKIERGTYDKSGDSLASVRVSYARFPRLKGLL